MAMLGENEPTIRYVLTDAIINKVRGENESRLEFDSFDLPHDFFDIIYYPNKRHDPDADKFVMARVKEISATRIFLMTIVESNRGESIFVGFDVDVIREDGKFFLDPVQENGKTMAQLSDNFDPKRANEFNIKGAQMLSDFLAALSLRGHVEGTETRVKKTGKGKGKKVYSKITYIYLEEKKKIATYGNKSINWSSSWPVRGHWRYKDGLIGKNRHGERCENGRTWVVPHDKQIHLESKPKPRIFK